MESPPSPLQEAQILLVEDNPGDVRLIKESFNDSRIYENLHTVTDGQEALDFIYRNDPYQNAPRPDTVLLDLRLPKVDGEDLLHEIKHHPELEHVPVIVITGMEEEVIESQDLDHDADEDAVLQKPVELGEFVEVIREFNNFGLSVVCTSRD